MGIVMVTRQFNQTIQQRAPMSCSCPIVLDSSEQPLLPSSDQKVHSACSFDSVKPWFFKPRKSRYGLEDDFKKVKKFNSLHWSQEQNEKYVQFLKGFMQLVNGDTLQKRKYHLNRMLSKHIGTRSPVQCRSHHQKMIKVYKTTEAIIAHFDCSNSALDMSECLLLESSSSLALQNSPAHHLQSTGTTPEEKHCLEQQKMKGEEEIHLNRMDENSLWDVLTYPLLQDSLNDL